MPMRTQAHEGGTNVTIHLGKQFLILHLEYAFYNALLHSFTRNYGDKKSRPDHVLLSPALLYKLVCSFKMWDTCASDHAALSTELRVNVVGGECVNTKHTGLASVSTTWFCVGSMRRLTCMLGISRKTWSC